MKGLRCTQMKIEKHNKAKRFIIDCFFLNIHSKYFMQESIQQWIEYTKKEEMEQQWQQLCSALQRYGALGSGENFRLL